MDGERNVIHPLSGIAVLPQLDLWSVPATQLSIAKDLEPEYRPNANVVDGQPIEFIINSAIDEYINLRETKLYVKMRVNLKKNDATPITDADWNSVVPCNYLMHSMFSQCDVEIGGKDVSLSPQAYQYKAFFEALTGFSPIAKKTVLKGALYEENTTTRNQIVRCEKNSKEPKHGKWFEMKGRLHIDLTYNCSKLLLGGSEIRIRLIPSTSRFIFKCGQNLSPELEFSEVKLIVKKSKTTQMLTTVQNKLLVEHKSRYAFTRSEVRYQSIGQDKLDAVLQNVIRGQLPRRMFIFLVESESFNGSFGSDPFEFKNFKLNYLAAFVDGTQHPAIPFTPDFDQKHCLREYQELFNVLDADNMDPTLDLTYESFMADRCIYAFQFSPDCSNGPEDGGHVNPIGYGSLSLHLRFHEKLPKAVNLLMYCEFDSMLEIDRDRIVKTNYN